MSQHDPYWEPPYGAEIDPPDLGGVTFAEAVAAELAKWRDDPDGQRRVAVSWIKVAADVGRADGEIVADVRAVLAALNQLK